MKLSAAFEASIALSFGDVSDAYQSFPSTLGISDNPDYRANLQHCRITDIDYKRNHAGVSDHVRQTVRWWRRPSRALSTPHRPKAGKPMTQPAVDPLNRHRFILADIVSPNRQERVVRRIIICTVQLQGFSRSSNRFSVAASRPPHSQSTRQSDQKPARSTACSFLRNSVGSRGSISLLEDVAQRLRPSLEVGQNPLPVALLVVGGAGIGIVHPMA